MVDQRGTQYRISTNKPANLLLADFFVGTDNRRHIRRSGLQTLHVPSHGPCGNTSNLPGKHACI